MASICAIHQPNFFPWLGYFDKIRQADIFVFLDGVAYPKSGSGSGSWCNRSRVLINKEAKWLGCPIRKEHGIQLIHHVQIDDRQPWRKKMLKTLEYNYCHAHNYEKAMELLQPLILFETDNLAEFNIHAIKTIAKYLSLEIIFKRQSELPVAGHSNELLVNIVKNADASVYLCGGGASEYQNDTYFESKGIEVKYQNFQSKSYDTDNSHLLGLSIIDYLMKHNNGMK